MEKSDVPPSLTLRRLINGYQITQAISVAAVLGIADQIADGTSRSDYLAAKTGSHPDALYRLLRALASVGVLKEEAGHRFVLTEVGQFLRVDAKQSMAGWAQFVAGASQWPVWGNLLHSVRTGENAFRDLHGMDIWEWRSRHPEESELFDNAMASLSSQVAMAVLDAYDFSEFQSIVDVGGGTGTLLAAILSRYPTLTGVLYDLPQVVANADAVLNAAGIFDRCRVIGGDFFVDVPSGGAAYLMKSIIHDWEDAEALQILKTCRRAMQVGSKLLLVERDLGEPNQNPETKFSDLNMLVAPGGRERTKDEYSRLFEAAGFHFLKLVPTRLDFGVLEAIAV
jgi:SAM-dependent methyltransferase